MMHREDRDKKYKKKINRRDRYTVIGKLEETL
jgi:hypothetical protein